MSWPLATVDARAWTEAGQRLHAGELSLISLWGEPGEARMAVLGESRPPALLRLACPDGRLPSIGRLHAPAIRLERALRDLAGLEATGATDLRPWLRHEAPYAFLPAEGEGLHQIPVGPVHAGIIEPGHFRFTANGEAIVRLEERLGYVHKGIDALMAGASLERAATLAGRVSGDSTVAYALAFARAVEDAAGVDVPPRAAWLRALAAELERLANHFGDIGAVCNDAAFTILHAGCGWLREQVLRVAQACFGHRLMMDSVVPGGMRADLASEGTAALRSLLELARRRFPELVDLYENTASLKDRTVDTGILAPALARQYGAGGYVGRASGRDFDARRFPGYAPYDALRFEVPVVQAGDVNARVWIRIQEVPQSLALVEQILEGLPAGPILAPPRAGAGEGAALVEGFRGDIFAWVRLRDGGVERSHLRDPSWFQWPLLEAAIEGNIVADFPLCNKSFNCSYSGHDL
jgi:Ni,Fe-hydrogenase III large subunit